MDGRTGEGNVSLVGSALRDGIMVAVVLILILVVLPAALTAQTAGLH